MKDRNVKFQFQIKKLISNLTIWAAVLAAIFYSSWPLGFIINPTVSHHDLASELEASHQPYNWLFIALDILTGLVLIYSGIIQWRKSPHKIVLKLSILGYMLFGILVIAAAVAPYNCNSIVQNCGLLPDQPMDIIHGLASIFSVVFLFFSLLLLCKMVIEQHFYHWLTILGIIVLISWGIVGIDAFIQILDNVKSNLIIIQNFFITLCSISIFVSIVLIEHFSARPKLHPKAKRRIFH